MLVERVEILFDGVIDADIDDFETGPFEHHRYQVLADVVDIALDGADHDLADRLDAGFGEQRTQDFHAALHGIRGKEHFGHEQDAVAKVDADDAHAFDKPIVQHPFRRPAALEKNTGGLLYLDLEAVVEIVMHLFGEL